MTTILIKAFFTHILVLVCFACIPVFFAIQSGVGLSSDNSLMMWRLFLLVLFEAALVLGIVETLRPSVSVSLHLLRKRDLNDQIIREKLCLLIFSIGEICIALAGLYFGGFITFNP